MSSSKENISIHDQNRNILYYKFPQGDEQDITHFDNFRFILNIDGTLWKEGNLYLLWMIEENPDISWKTIKIHSEALEDYKRFCDREAIDWKVAKRITSRPNWKYRGYLETRMSDGKLKPSTVQKMIRPVTAFYKYLVDVRNMYFDVPLFKVSQNIITYANKYGLGGGKIVESADINQIRATFNEFDGYIRDEGKLRPLLKEQQIALFEALDELGNVEMKLAFMFSVVTGARMQTVFTLRLKHFISSLPEDYSQAGIRIWFIENETILEKSYFQYVGPGTDIDTKGDKYHQLMIPGWMKRAIMVYIVSKRALKRRQKALSQNHDLDQYVFITQRNHQPFYMAKNDINKDAYKIPPTGGALLSFETEKLRPLLQKKGHKFPFKFHDMRATFAMNYIERNWSFVDNKVWTEMQLRKNLQKLMGHSDEKTTQGYLDHRNMTQMLEEGQDEHEKKLIGWVLDDDNL